MSDFDANLQSKIKAHEDERSAERRRIAKMDGEIYAEWREFLPLMRETYEAIRVYAGWYTVRFRSMQMTYEGGPYYHEFSLMKKPKDGNEKQSVVWACISMEHKKKYSNPAERWSFSAPPHRGHMSKVNGRWMVVIKASQPPVEIDGLVADAFAPHLVGVRQSESANFLRSFFDF
jgi:hypothetical protein